MKQLDDLLARIPELQAKSREREKARQSKAEKGNGRAVAVVVQLPLWAEALRCLPGIADRTWRLDAERRIVG